MIWETATYHKSTNYQICDTSIGRYVVKKVYGGFSVRLNGVQVDNARTMEEGKNKAAMDLEGR